MQPGHWEADFMLFSRYGQNLLVLHERHTRFTLVDHLANRKASLTAEAIAANLMAFPNHLRKTISFDNGPEFSEHHCLHDTLGVQTFFCDPHSPWQKGGIENAIGRLRRTLPRKTDLRDLSLTVIAEQARRLNRTPRKCLGFKTPEEVFFELRSTVALQA
jgi:IS30 family transposase